MVRPLFCCLNEYVGEGKAERKRIAVLILADFERLFKARMPTTAVQEKGEESEGIRDTAEAQWKKRNKLS